MGSEPHAFPSISHGSGTLQPFGCCTRAHTVPGELRSPKGTALPHQKGSCVPWPLAPQFSLDGSSGVACPNYISTNKRRPVPVPIMGRDARRSFSGRILHPRPLLTQALSAEAPQLCQAPAPRRAPTLELLLTVSICAHEHV